VLVHLILATNLNICETDEHAIIVDVGLKG